MNYFSPEAGYTCPPDLASKSDIYELWTDYV